MKKIILVLFILTLLGISTPNAEARLRAECFVSPSNNVVPGEEVRWRVVPEGGKEVYSFEWSGGEGLTGNQNEAYITYRTSGIKNATVLVTSGEESERVTCSQILVEYTPLRGACYVKTSMSQSSVVSTYTTDIMGGTGSYTYEWSGTDGLSGNENRVSHSYKKPGFKVATVNVSSADKNLKLTCNTEVPEIRKLPRKEIIFGCQANTDNFTSDSPFEWETIYSAPSTNRSVREIRDDVSFRWTGTEGIRESSEDILVEYDDKGYKSIEHRVFDEHIGLRTEHICQAYLVDKKKISDRKTSRKSLRSKRSQTDERFISSGIRFDTNFNSCLIASASAGTEWEPHETNIRAWRDSYLKDNQIGKVIESTYDHISPGYALVLEQSDLLRMHVRTGLIPIDFFLQTFFD